MVIPTPGFEPRLQRRYEKLVNEHLHTSENQAAGARALPGVNEAFASTQAAWRFYSNPNVSAPGLVGPLIEQAKLDLPVVSRRYGLAIHDWSDLVYATHESKKDRKKIGTELGYKLATTLLVSDLNGFPIAPISLGLWANDGWHTTLDDQVRSELSPLALVSETMLFLNRQKLPLPLVHLLDREGDSIFHYRQWEAAGDLFLVRADAVQRVVWQGRTQLLCDVAAQVALQAGLAVEISANVIGQLLVGETSIVIDRPAFPRGREGKRQWVKGEPLNLRLVVCQLRLPDGTIEAEWYLLSNVPAETRAEQLAEWYYWRWRIEIVCTQLTKAHFFTRGTGRDRVANLDQIIRHNDAIDQQLDQLSFLVEGQTGQRAGDTLSELGHSGGVTGQFRLLGGLVVEVLQLLVERLLLCFQIPAATLVFRQRHNAAEISVRQAFELSPEARLPAPKLGTTCLEVLRQPGPAACLL
jgi:hypothetical protein